MLSSCDDETEVMAPVPVPMLSPSTSTSAVVVIEPHPAAADCEAEQRNQPPVQHHNHQQQQQKNGGGGDSSNSAATKRHHRRRFRRCCPIVPNGGGALCALDASVRRRANSEGHIQQQQRSGHSASLISSPKQQRFFRLCKAEQNAAGAPPSPQAVRAAATAVQRAPYDDSSTDDTSRATTTTVSNRYLKCPQRGGESCGDLVPKGSDGHLAAGIANGTTAAAEEERDLVLTINVSGTHFQTFESTLRRFPDSLLGDPLKRKELWNEQLHETFLDRSSQCFEAILHIYRSGGQVIRPAAIPVELFIDELVFYELKDDVWANFCESEGCRVRSACKKPNNKFQRKIWDLMEHPDTSPLARLIAALSVAVIIISTVSFCLESIPELKPSEMSREWSSPFFWIEFGCCLWFSIELFVRFLASPSKTEFMKSFLNVLDFVAVAPFFVNLMYHNNEYSSIRSANAAASSTSSSASFAVLRIVRLVRVFRIFKLSRHFTGLQVLGKTFKASVQEFFLLIFFMGIALVLFSSGVYFAEQGEPGTKFTSIPASFWFVLATMTTVGYGDLVPHGVYGKIVGSCCALIGVLTLALPVPIIVANFKRFYRQEIILAKMYEQNPPPKQVKAIIMHARAEEESINAPILGGGPKAVTPPTRATAQFVQKISV
uniref:BTB domain-containing protein n=1 Tax=Globodera rostochiensis TaxID=31243 RepID=A0A914HI27_GLORO